jgi:Zn-dependent peptidase ImmA (M78 family)
MVLKGEMSMFINEIKDKVKELRKQYSLNSIPVDLTDLLEKENIKVIDKDFSELERKANKPISGILYIDNDSKLILVNERDNLRRKNFTVAHELGHYFLHYDRSKQDEVFVSFRGDINPRETEANKFAAELLLPDDKVKKEYDSVLFPTASYLADKFDVSEQAMSIKLEQMGLSYIGL